MAALERWIREGAVWPSTLTTARHWAYVKPARVEPPTPQRRDWARNPVDRFVLARLEAEGLQPSPPAATATLVRRLYLALTGLPPPVAEVERLERLGNPLPAAEIGRLTDRLLQSEEFGVRWARPWLDLARYADSHGFQRDDLREVWGFRDWVVRALNADLPFDRFTIEQLAGDLLPGASADQIIATGFHRCTPTNVEAGTDPEESRIQQVLDRVNTTGAVWLGTTLECAQCHNHKYDPFSQEDYYRLLAFFNSTEKEAERTNPKVPGSIAFRGSPLPLPDTAPNPQRAKLEAEKAALTRRLETLGAGDETAFQSWLADMRAAVRQPLSEQGLEVIEFVSENGAGHRVLDDGSVLVTGATPATDTYRLVLRSPTQRKIAGLRLDALTHDSLPGRGPGRGDAQRPNFVLNSLEARLRAADAKDDPGRALRFLRASADFAQARFAPEGAIDGDAKTAWAINPQFGQPHWARFELEQPTDLAPGQELVVTLRQEYGGGRTLGRVRLSAITGSLAAAALPEPLVQGLLQPQPDAGQTARLRQHFERSRPGLAALRSAVARVDAELAKLQPPTTEVMRELPQPRMSFVFKRGVHTDPGPAVQPGTPAVLPPAPEAKTRLDLARWLVSPENPLTARVTVNRWWGELFGQGLVRTPEDFGLKGERPTHPELLDWLAVRFMQDGWSMKKLLRLIATSATFAQQAVVTPELLERDPANRLLARGPRFRLPAETVRDNALAVAGLLSSAKGGPPVYPPQPEGLWRKVGGQQYDYVVSPGEQAYRRGLYVVLKRGAPHPSLVNFDATARLACVVQRSRSNTPLQALTLLNDPVHVEAARAFAQRVLREVPAGGDEARLIHAFRLAVARQPAPAELAVLRHLLEQRRPRGTAEAWQAVTSALLNLDECITQE